MSVIKFGGWETGDTSETPGGGAPTATNPHSGGAYCLSGGSATIPVSAGTTIYFRIWVNLTTAPTASWNLIAVNGASVLRAAVQITTVGQIAVIIEGKSASFNTFAPFNQWFLLELSVKGTATSFAEIRVDGTVVVSNSGTTTFTPDQIVLTGTGTGATARFDDWCVRDDAYPGPGLCIARQFQSGTPTYNAWTKTGAASIDLCWSSTPFSATAFAVASAASQAQTGLVSSFSATQTGHGTGIIGPGDTINAVKVGVVGKRGSGSTTTHVIRFRYNGVDNNSADWTAIGTTDTYLEYYPPIAATIALLNASEAGGVQGSASSQVFTIEDAWVIVDYTPAPPQPVGKTIQLNQAIKRSSIY